MLKHKKLHKLIITIIFSGPILATAAPAHELYALLGPFYSQHQNSHAWGAEYIQGINQILAFDISYYNEGHFSNHHRDGISLEILGRTYFLDNQFSLSASIGPYLYFDTTFPAKNSSYANKQNLGLRYGLATTYYGFNPLLLKLSLDRIETFSSINTATVILGIGYNLDIDNQRLSHSEPQWLHNEITLFAGQTAVNSNHVQRSIAESLEYRHYCNEYIEGTISWINEGHTQLVNRTGIAAEGWATHSFFNDQFSLGIGAGPYVTNTHKQHLNGLVSITANYHFDSQWSVRGTWHRVITHINRDSDIFLLGVGYKF